MEMKGMKHPVTEGNPSTGAMQRTLGKNHMDTRHANLFAAKPEKNKRNAISRRAAKLTGSMGGNFNSND